MSTIEVLTLLIAMAGLALGVVNSYVQWRAHRADRADLRISAMATRERPDLAEGQEDRTGQQGGHWVVRFVARNAGKRPITVIEAGVRTPRGGRIKLAQTFGSSIGRVLGEQDQAEMFAGLRKFAAEHASKGPYVALWFQDADLHYHEMKLRTRELDRWARSDHAEPANHEPIVLTSMGRGLTDPELD